MKRTWCFLLALACCLALWGCRSSDAAQPSDAPSLSPTQSPETTAPESGSGQLSVEKPGKVRIAYTGMRSGVQYISDADALPDNDALAQYDEAFFREHALVLVTETVGSGSVEVGIEAIAVLDGNAAVTLSHKAPDGDGTTDMATWLLWVEADAGLDYSWTLENPALTSETATK